MKLHSLYIYCLLAFLLPLHLGAQDMKIVQGRVLNKGDKNKPFTETVYIYAFFTEAAAAEAYEAIKSHTADNLYLAGQTEADAMGNYEIRVPDNGALIFQVSVADPVLERVRRRMEINVFIDASIILEDVIVEGMSTGINLEPISPEIIGDKLVAKNTFPLASQYGKENARLIIQPYVVDCTTDDTVSFLRPMVFDGKQYKTTQHRRMDFDNKHDPLSRFVCKDTLTDQRKQIPWQDTVKLPNPDRNYHVNAILHLEDYRKVYYEEDFLTMTCNARRPLKFLEYSTGSYDLPAQEHYIKPKRERVNGSENAQLTFLASKAQLDPDNPANEINMKRMQQKLLDIVHGEGTTLQKFSAFVTSSPEGSYAINMSLTNQRAAFAQQQALSCLPERVRKTTYFPRPQGEIASWTEVADSLESDSLPEYAERIRAIVDKYPKNMDAQYAQIRALPFYNSHIKDILPHLRRARFEWQHEIYRELTPKEIFDRYLYDEDYRSGRKQFELYEYWHLFNMEKDPKKLRKLYRDALRMSEERGAPWVYAANKLVISYLIEGDTIDLNLLEPFIDRHRPINFEVRNMDNKVIAKINRPEVVANQLAMYLKSNKFSEASVLAQMLPKTEEYKELWAFTMCMGGYYKTNKEVFERVKNSSPINEIVMYLSRDTKAFDDFALEAANQLRNSNPLKWYFKAVLAKRAKDLTMEDNYLQFCFNLDPKYIPIAQQDGDLDEEAVGLAVDMYEFALVPPDEDEEGTATEAE